MFIKGRKPSPLRSRVRSNPNSRISDTNRTLWCPWIHLVVQPTQSEKSFVVIVFYENTQFFQFITPYGFYFLECYNSIIYKFLYLKKEQNKMLRIITHLRPFLALTLRSFFIYIENLPRFFKIISQNGEDQFLLTGDNFCRLQMLYTTMLC